MASTTNSLPSSSALSQNYALMLARMLIFAIEDFQTLGMEDWSLRLGEGVTEIMKKFDLSEAEIRFREEGKIN